VIIGIASAAIGLSIKPDPLQSLRKDAERLSQLLQMAQAEARVDGRPITWRADAKGHGFSRRSADGQGLEHFEGDPQLHARPWDSTPLQVRIEPRQTLVLDAEWINPPLRLVLSDGQRSLGLQRDADGRLRLVNQP